jgi:hypothetical protein
MVKNFAGWLNGCFRAFIPKAAAGHDEIEKSSSERLV